MDLLVPLRAQLVVMQVLPHSQASRFELQLMGADVIAINGTRIMYVLLYYCTIYNILC